MAVDAVPKVIRAHQFSRLCLCDLAPTTKARVNPCVFAFGLFRKMETGHSAIAAITINLCPSSPAFKATVWSVLLTSGNALEVRHDCVQRNGVLRLFYHQSVDCPAGIFPLASGLVERRSRRGHCTSFTTFSAIDPKTSGCQPEIP